MTTGDGELPYLTAVQRGLCVVSHTAPRYGSSTFTGDDERSSAAGLSPTPSWPV